MEMRITRSPNVNEIYKPSVINKPQILSRAEEKDSVTISERGKEFQTALKAVMNTPDIREDKVNRIKNDIDSGNYNVSAEEIASKMVDNYIAKKYGK